ncbi:GPI-anchored wall transfer protein 1 [Monosporozyma unispora]|nr:Glucosaminyl phosphatidylinositol (GlcN-PI) nositol acylation protein [Kazachstania unispora]
MPTLKQRKEEFVTGLHGGSIEEINLVSSVAIFAYICVKLLNQVSSTGHINPIIDFSLNWVCLLFATTLYSSEVGLLISLMTIPCLAIYIFGKTYFAVKTKGKKRTAEKPKSNEATFKLVKKPYITAYRSHMLILTCLCIIAVDFPIFPRRFAKVETWGTSLMDLGVGSFVFSNGLVSARSLLKSSKRVPFHKRVFSALRSCQTLLVLGLLRLYFVKNLEYQEHVTEYGVHWNFFVTLSLLPIVLVIVDPITDYIPRFVIALVISGVYEWFLVKDDVFLNYLILAPRNNIISANREGIASFIGYCAIFIWGQSTGYYLLGNIPTKNNLYKASITPLKTKNNTKACLWDRMTTVTPVKGLLVWFSITFVITKFILVVHPQDISRRFANLPYTFWIVTFNTGYLAVYSAVDKIFNSGNGEESTSSVCLEAMNTNGLVLFLLANVTTGLINMSVSTIDMPDTLAIATLLGYATFITLVSSLLYVNKIFIRL